MADDGTPSMASVLDALTLADDRRILGIQHTPHWCPMSAYPHPDCGLNCGCSGCKTPEQYEAYQRAWLRFNPEENPMSEPLDPQDAQNPDDTSGTADDADALQGDIASGSDDE